MYVYLFQIEIIDIDCLTNEELAQLADWIVGLYWTPAADTVVRSVSEKIEKGSRKHSVLTRAAVDCLDILTT